LNEAVLPYGFVGKIHQVILWPRIGFLETLRVTVTGITWNPGGARLRFRLIKAEEVVRDIITPHFMNFPEFWRRELGGESGKREGEGTNY